MIERWWPESITREPVYYDDAVVLFHADAREILPQIPDKSISHTMTDPPYDDASHTYGKLRDDKGRIALTKLSFVSIEESFGREKSSKHIVRITKGWALAFGETEGMGDWKRTLEKWGAAWARAQWWEKPDGAPMVTGAKPGVPGEAIATVWCNPGTRSTWQGGGLRGFYSVPVREAGERIHETQKPLALMTILIDRFTMRGDLICDPFAGSGTTGVACKLRGRRCILVERDEKLIPKLINRLKTTKEQGLLFGDDVMARVEKAQGIVIDGVDISKKVRKPRVLP